MIIYFADRAMNILGIAGTELLAGLVVQDDLRTIDIDSGVAVFDFRIQYAPAERVRVEEMCRAGNYLLRNYKGRQEFYTIISNENDIEKGEFYVYSEDAGLDLLNETAPAYTAPEANNIEFYLNRYIYDSGFEIGVNEIPDLSRKLKWEEESTVTERLRSIATQFDNAELGFRFEIDKLSVKHKYVDVYKSRGSNTDVQLRIGREVKNILVRESIESLATALRPVGGTPEGSNTPVTLSGYTYDDGDMYVSGPYLFSREALKKWSRYVSRDESGNDVGHIVRAYSYDTTSQQTLCAHAVTQLKKICDMDVNYEIELLMLPDSISIGDRVNIVDKEGELYLSARILSMKECAVRDTCKVTLGEHLIKDSGINTKLEELSVKYQELTAKSVLHTWIVYADDPAGTNISTDPTGRKYMGVSGNHVNEEPDLSDPTVYAWSLIQGEDGFSPEVTVTKEDSTTTITVTDSTGTTTETVGDGFSPEVTITKEEDKTTISITDATGTKTATIEDGKFIWNLLKEKDIPAVSFTNKGITYEYEGNGWWYIHGTVTGNDVGAVTLYGVDSTGNLITSNSDICVCVEKNTSPLIDDKSRIQIRYAENSSAQTMSDAYISESWSGMKVSVDANGVMHFGSRDVTVDANGIMSFPEMFTDVDQDGVLQFMTYDDRIILNHTHNNGYRVAAIRHYLSADATGTVISGRIRIMLVNGSTVNGWTPNESDVAPVTVMLTNSNHTFAGGASAALGGSVDCAVVAHKGAVPCPAHVGTITGCPTGMSTSISGNDTTAATITITVTTSMATADGTLTVPVTVENQLFNLIFSYSIAKKGKGSRVFHQSTAPSASLGLEMGDTWFDTAHDYEIYTWNGTDWVPEPLGADAISAGAIVASHIAAGAITTDKISANGISAGVITAGILLSEDESTYFDLENDKIVTGNTSGEYTEISNGSVKFKNSNVRSEFTYKVDGNRRGLNIDSDDPIYFGPFLDPALIYNPVIDDTIENYTLEAMRGIATHQGVEIFNDVSDTPYIDFHITHSGTVLDYDYRMRMNPGYPDILSFVSPSGATLRVEKEVYTENCMSVRTTPNSGQKPRFDFFYQRYANSNRNNQSAYIEENSAGELIAHNTIANASDEVLKKDIVPLNGKFMDLVDKLQPKEYRFRQGDDNLKIGFVAQDVIRSMDDLGIIDQPIVVGSGCGEDYYGLDYSQIITILVAYCQDLRREINALKSGEN